jgi:hypothetical protein
MDTWRLFFFVITSVPWLPGLSNARSKRPKGDTGSVLAEPGVIITGCGDLGLGACGGMGNTGSCPGRRVILSQTSRCQGRDSPGVMSRAYAAPT